MIEKRLIDTRETAKVLRCGMNQVYRLCKKPDFPCLRIGNKLLVDLDALLNVWIPNQMHTMIKR